MKLAINNIKKFFIDMIFPPLCFSCKKKLKSTNQSKGGFCEECFSKIKINKGSFIKTKTQNKEFILASAGSYKNKAIRNTIHTLKYKRIKRAIDPLNNFVVKPYTESVLHLFKNKDWKILPVPLYKSKRTKRGFNQSQLIAEKLGAILKENNIESEIKNDILTKSTKTKPQARLKGQKRKNNLKNSFSIQNTESIKNKNIIIVDDVYTTGSTAKEIIKLLNKENVGDIIVFTIAKTKAMV